jgi:two-component system, OmpR family, KDP operon response regulator KdpE
VLTRRFPSCRRQSAAVRVAYVVGDGRSTGGEYDLLAHITRNVGKVLTHRQILQAVGGAESGEEADCVWTYVRRIRRKIEPEQEQPRYLLTEAGVGYRMQDPD